MYDKNTGLQLLLDYTDNMHNFYALAGKFRTARRQEIMSHLCGQKVTQTQAGLNKLFAKLKLMFPRRADDVCYEKRLEMLRHDIKKHLTKTEAL